MTRNTPKEMRYDRLGPQVVKALEKRHMAAYYCETKEAALEKALSLIPENDVVSWGGSMSVVGIGLQDALKERGTAVLDRALAKDAEESEATMRQALLCDTFLCSTNAMSEDGILVNMDGIGNRVAAMIFGPKQVVMIVGMNKVVKTEADAISRCRNIAAPINAQRFGLSTPCAITGACGNCNSPDCICNYMSVIRGCRPAEKIKVILVGEDLGF